jgi:hypothetical protein
MGRKERGQEGKIGRRKDGVKKEVCTWERTVT